MKGVVSYDDVAARMHGIAHRSPAYRQGVRWHSHADIINEHAAPAARHIASLVPAWGSFSTLFLYFFSKGDKLGGVTDCIKILIAVHLGGRRVRVEFVPFF